MAKKKTTGKSQDELGKLSLPENKSILNPDSLKPIPDEMAGVDEQAIVPLFPVVGIGASAGGLAAFETFFENMPEVSESGMAFVLVQHLDPGHKSILAELIRHYTQMHVHEVEDGMSIEPNCIYIIPPNKDMGISHGQLHLTEPFAPRGLRLPIDSFFRSLAQDRGEQAICIVLSGTGTDGTQGMKAIKEAGGMAMVQESESASYDGMPRSAIATGLADFILPLRDMPAQLESYIQHAYGNMRMSVVEPPLDLTNWIQRILILLRAQSGHDFSYYKKTTILRRIEKRMVVNQIERTDHYYQYLRQNPVEVETLFRELLIGVTSFFRDPEAFEALRKIAIPALYSERSVGDTLRVWVPGCSTGEEAFSIAILLQEHMDVLGKPFTIQVFATDIDHDAIEKARSGLYPGSIAADLSPERLERFFIQEDGFYRVKKNIRDMVVFAEQDVIKDPPFSRIDLLTCRNLFIYWETDLQKKVFSLFHYSLRPGGYLFMGSSESIGNPNLFMLVDRKWKIYRRKPGITQGATFDLAAHHFREGPSPVLTGAGSKEVKTSPQDITEKLLMRDYSPACVLVNEQGEIIYVHGHTGKYLELPTGEINTNVLRSVREGLRLELTNSLRKCVAQGKPVRINGLKVKNNGDILGVNLVVKPADALEPGLFLVIFEDFPLITEEAVAHIKATDDLQTDKTHHIATLERELRAKEEYLQTTVEELETANEELKSTNEELQSTNEELQSTNEELETSKEELQSVNEELVTVNNELQQKIEELSRTNNDMNNLMAGTGIGTVFVDKALYIQRFTPAATTIINLIHGDVGRPLSHIVSNLVSYHYLEEDVKLVLDDLVPRETEVQAKNGNWYLMRVQPYRTLENVIDGAVITFVDVTKQKLLQDSLQESESLFKSIVEKTQGLVWSVDTKYRLTMANSNFSTAVNNIHGRELKLGEPLPPEWLEQSDITGWIERYDRALRGETFRDEVITHDPSGKSIVYGYSFHPVRDEAGQVMGVVCFGDDVTERDRGRDVITRLSAVVWDANDAITVYDFDGQILAWNPAAERLYGWSESEALSMNMQAMVPENKRAETDAILKNLTQGDIIQPLETTRVAKDGKVFAVRVIATALKNGSGKPFAVATTEQAVTRIG